MPASVALPFLDRKSLGGFQRHTSIGFSPFPHAQVSRTGEWGRTSQSCQVLGNLHSGDVRASHSHLPTMKEKGTADVLT